MLIQKDLLQVRTPALNFYVLRDSRGLYVIDGGFVGGRTFLEKALHKVGWETEPISGILVTHGHLDHILNTAKLANEYQSPIWAPRLDLNHYQGNSKYSGWAMVTTLLEAIGRRVLGFQSFTPDRLLDDGEILDIWGGLQVVHLPGHTNGHSGFYSPSCKLLFSSDLFASYGFRTHFPPAIFNLDGTKLRSSAEKALSLDLQGVIPNHADRATPNEHLRRLRKLAGRFTQR